MAGSKAGTNIYDAIPDSGATVRIPSRPLSQAEIDASIEQYYQRPGWAKER